MLILHDEVVCTVCSFYVSSNYVDNSRSSIFQHSYSIYLPPPPPPCLRHFARNEYQSAIDDGILSMRNWNSETEKLPQMAKIGI